MVKVSIHKSRLSGTTRSPSSKSYTHRAVFLAALSEGESQIIDPLVSRDTLSSINACRALGTKVLHKDSSLMITGMPLTVPESVIDSGNSGTTLRIATSISSLIESGYAVLTGDCSLRTRPMSALLEALNNLGEHCYSTKLNGTAPIVVKGGGLQGGNVTMNGSISSQFISSILIAGVRARTDIFIQIEGDQVSRPYIDSTIAVMERFGARVEKDYNMRNLMIKRGSYTCCTFHVPSDLSSASLLMAAGVLTGDDKVKLSGLSFDLPQGDSKIIDIINQMNGKISVDKLKGEVVIEGSEKLGGGEFDLHDSPDLMPVVSILALKAKNRVTLKGVSHVRYKETDRVKNISTELRKLGAVVEESTDRITITSPSYLRNASLDSYGDHRLFMAFAIASLLTQHSTLTGAESVDVSYPGFLNDIVKLGANISSCDGQES